LDRLVDLGVDALWLLPIHPISKVKAQGRFGSPFAVADHFATHPDCGGLAEFDALVAACHARGLKLYLEWVAHHTGWDHPWLQAHPDWYVQDATGQITHPPGTPWHDVAALDLSSPSLRRELLRALRFWVDDHGVDGFRFDHATGLPPAFWHDLHRAFADRPDLHFFADGSPAWLHHQAGIHTSFSRPLLDAVKSVFINGQSVHEIASAYHTESAQLPEAHTPLRLLTYHDENAWKAPAPELFHGPSGALAAFAVLASLPGDLLAFHGQEVGCPQRLDLFEHTPISWGVSSTAFHAHQDLLRWRKRIHLTKESELTIHPHEDVWILSYKVHGHLAALIAVNCRNHSARPFTAQLVIPVPNALNTPPLTEIQLAPFEIKVFAGV
jgi:glycosidase